MRLDSQFQSQAALIAIERIRSRSHSQISDFTIRPLKGRSIPYNEDGAFSVIRSGDISEALNEEGLLKSSALDEAFFVEKNDVLISSIGQGSIGKIQLFRSDGRFATVSEVTVVRTTGISSATVAAFLSSSYGQAQINRYITGATGQLHLYPNDVDRIFIPNFTEDFDTKIQELYDQQWKSYKDGKKAFSSANYILMKALKLTDWAPPQPLTFTATSADVFAAGRFDSQYFRPLFSDVEERLNVTGKAIELGKLLDLNSRGRQPAYAPHGLPVVNSKHVRTNRVIVDDSNRRAIGEGSSAIIEKGDVLMNGTGVGTIGRAAPYLNDDKALPDNHVTILRTKVMDPIFLAAFLNSPLGQWQIERLTKGSSGQVEIYPKDIEKILVWNAPEAIQRSVRQEILSGFNSEQKAIGLLETTKCAVEIAVEDCEAAAMSFIQEYERSN